MSNFPQESPDSIKKFRAGTIDEADRSEALRWILTLFDSAYILIDGLDEWPSEDGRRSRLLEWIVRLDAWHLPQLHVLVTSQSLPDIKQTLSNKRALRIDSRQDIFIHVKHNFHTDQHLTHFDHALKTDVENFLIDGSDEG